MNGARLSGVGAASDAPLGGAAFGGHLMEMHVDSALEMIVTESPTHLRKRSLPDLPIATIRLAER